MKTFKMSTLVLMVVLAACGGGGSGGDSAPTNPPAPPPPSGDSGSGNSDPFTDNAAPAAGVKTSNRQEIIDLMYNDSYVAPEKFYKDLRAGLKVVHLLDDDKDNERCDEGADDFLNLTAAYLDTVSDSYSLLETSDGKFYYEQTAVVMDGAGGSETIYVRSFKCWAVNRDGVDILLVDDEIDNTYGGKLLMNVDFNTLEDKRALVGSATIQFSQYIFGLSNAGSKVVNVETVDEDSTVTHAITFATITKTVGSCDTIKVAKVSNTTDKKANYDTIGNVTRNYETLDTFGVDGTDRVVVESCE